MSNLQLATSNVCPFAQRTRMALHEKGIEYEPLEIEFVGDSFNKPDWFLALTPTGLMPVLKHAGEVVYDSDIVNEYIEEVFPGSPLLPTDPAKRASVRFAGSVGSSGVRQASSAGFKTVALPMASAGPRVRPNICAG